MKKAVGFWVLLVLGLFLALGGIIQTKANLISFISQPAGVIAVALLIGAFIIKKRTNKK